LLSKIKRYDAEKFDYSQPAMRDNLPYARTQSEYVYQITLALKNLNEDLRSKLEAKIMFNKTQNLLRNLSFHTALLRLFSLSQNVDINAPENQEYRKLINQLIDFFDLFTRYNIINQNLLLPHINGFFDIIDLNIQSSKLISNLVQSLSDEKKFERLIDLVFRKIEDICQNPELKDILH
jgi:hypothetical protein